MLKICKLITCLMIILISLSGCGMPGGKRREVPKIEMVVENPLDFKRTDEFVVLKVSDIKKVAPDFYQNTFIILDIDTNKEIPYQLDDVNNDGEGDEIAMIMDMEPKEKKKIIIRYSPQSPESRAVTLGHTRRTRTAIHHEYQGIGWESELIAYRLYLDDRNSISVFGKQEKGLSLDKYAKKLSDPKTKITSVFDGKDSLGCGGFGLWHDNRLIKPAGSRIYPRIIADGPVRSVFEVVIDNWNAGDQNLRITSIYSIFAGQRWSSNKIRIDKLNSPVKIASGLTKSNSIKLIKDDNAGFFYTYGAVSKLNPSDNVGLALIYPKEKLESIVESDSNYLAIMNIGKEEEITYWFTSAWSRGELGIKNDKEFAELVSSTALNLRNPLTVTIMPVKSGNKK